MYLQVSSCAIFLVLVTLLGYQHVDATPFSSLLHITSVPPSSIQDIPLESVSTTESHLEQSTSSSTSTTERISYVTTYWTAFINTSYVLQNNQTSVPMYHTDRSETGRYSTASNRDVHGVAVEMVSKSAKQKLSNDNSDNETLLYADDNSGCFPPFVDNYPHNESWIAVVKRGQCTFNEKVMHASALNASGILVYDYENGETLQSMKVEEYYQIPSVFTFNWKGQEIVDLIRSSGKVYLGLQKGSHCRTEMSTSVNAPLVRFCVPPDEWDSFKSLLTKQSPFWNWATRGHGNGTRTQGFTEKRTSVLFVSVSFIILMLISLAWLIFYYIQRFRYIHAKDQLERKLCSQAKRALQIISTNVLKKDDLDRKDFFDTCAVCIENYKVEDIVRILPCKHQFHKSCIDQWLLEKRTCPMCKMDILQHYGLVTEKGTGEGSGEPHEETSMHQFA